MDESLTFKEHWKARIKKAQAMLAQFNGLGNSQWGISATSWRQIYMRMIRAIPLWGSELGWRGQRGWEKEFEQLQYQALKKCVNTTHGSKTELVSQIAGVESPRKALDAAQARLMGKIMRDTTALGDLMSEDGSRRNTEAGREWDDFGQEYTIGPDGFTSVLTAIQSKAGVLKEKGHERISYGGKVEKTEVPEVKLQAQADSKAEVWTEAINQAREHYKATGIYPDGSMNEDGVVGAGWHVEGGTQGGVTLGKLATVWDSEVCRVRGALEDAPSNSNVLILSDSQAAIAAVKKAGRTGKARTNNLKLVLMDIKERQARLGPNAVSFGWVKAHNKLFGNEEADPLAKMATQLYPEDPQITEGGLKQAWRKIREEERRVKGAGMGRVVRWNRKARVTYIQCRTGKGNLQAWRHKIGKIDNPECRKCGKYAETGKHVALVCTHEEDVG